jgi:hypothetical protein
MIQHQFPAPLEEKNATSQCCVRNPVYVALSGEQRTKKTDPSNAAIGQIQYHLVQKLYGPERHVQRLD